MATVEGGVLGAKRSTVMFQASFGVDEIWMALTDPTNAVSNSFFSRDGELGEAYLEQIISKATI